MDDLLSSLNSEQQQAVLHFEGPALVIAGAGSGKTKTVVHRIAYLMKHHGVYPSEILAVTFTNKAAGEMKSRLSDMVGQPSKDLWVSTFHSSSLRILRVYGQQIGLKSGFVVYDDDDQTSLLKGILKELAVDAKPGSFKSMLDRIKNQSGSSERFFRDAPDYIGGIPKSSAEEIYRMYQAGLRAQGAVDFNDLLLHTIQLFEEHPDVLSRVQQRARFIHVDEYQDTNPVQYKITRLLAGDPRNLVVVGDPDQSIYGFRNADIKNILDFEVDYKGAKTFRLEKNYRSTSAILEVANAVIEKNIERLDKTLRAVKTGGDPVRIYKAPNAREEASFVAREILKLKDYQKTAILYRTNAQSRLLEEHLRRANIPARLVGAVGFFDRREIRDLLAYARVAVNPLDAVGVRRIVNVPPRGIGATTVGKLIDHASLNKISLLEAFKDAEHILSRADQVKKFVDLMDDLSDAAHELSPSEFLEKVLAETGFIESLRKEADGEDRMQNVEELLRAARDWETEEGGQLGDFLDSVALTAKAEEPSGEVPEESVTLMTLHNAKGLEFGTVFLVGLEENLLPHRNSVSRSEDIEEERRLFYVGVTRAEDKLYITHAEERETYGKREYSRSSRFLEDIPADLLKEIGAFGDTPVPTLSNTPPSSAKPKTVLSEFKGGEKVRHPKFGSGTIVAAMGPEVTVLFGNGIGLKKLAVKFAGLEIE